MKKLLNLFSRRKKKTDGSADKQKESVPLPTVPQVSENQKECGSKWDRIRLGLEKGFSNQEAIASMNRWINEMVQKCLDEGISSIAPKIGGIAGPFGAEDFWLNIGYQLRPSIKSSEKVQLCCIIVRDANGMCMEQMVINDSTPVEVRNLFIDDEIIEKSKKVWLDMAKRMWEEYT